MYIHLSRQHFRELQFETLTMSRYAYYSPYVTQQARLLKRYAWVLPTSGIEPVASTLIYPTTGTSKECQIAFLLHVTSDRHIKTAPKENLWCCYKSVILLSFCITESPRK